VDIAIESGVTGTIDDDRPHTSLQRGVDFFCVIAEEENFLYVELNEVRIRLLARQLQDYGGL